MAATADNSTSTPTATPTETPTYTPTPTVTATATPTELSLAPEAENSLLSGGVEDLEAAYYWYDGDGNMVKSEINGIVTYYVGKHYEKQVDGVTETLRKYYSAETNRLAMRAPQGAPQKPHISLILHLDSTRPRTTPGTQPISRMSRRGSAIHKNSPINGLSTNPFPYIMV